jgi:oxalate decarboxylase/phosphoglucose isomerase-like protein (cupin superfamily)
MQKESLIEQTKRARVVGNNGPRRQEMKTFAKIGKVSDELGATLNAIADTRTGNDLGGDNYNISQLCNVEEVFAPKSFYRQILLQEKNCEGDQVDEHVYTEYNEDVSIPFFKHIYRLRISEMMGEHEMNWHIDQDTSVICRAQLCLNDNDSVFQFKRKGKIEEFSMKPGEIWFINTGWSHRVVTNTKLRRSAIFGFDYKDYIGENNLCLFT